MHPQLFTTGSSPVARVALYVTDKNTFGDFFVAALLTTPLFELIPRMLNSTKARDRKKQEGHRDRKKQEGHSRE